MEEKINYSPPSKQRSFKSSQEWWVVLLGNFSKCVSLDLSESITGLGQENKIYVVGSVECSS